MKTKRQKSKSGGFPLAVEWGNATVKVYRSVSSKGYTSYRIANYYTRDKPGQRVLQTYTDLAEAKREAKAIAKRTSAGQDVDVLELRSSDRASYQRALELLEATGASLEVAASVFADACAVLGGNRIMEAARFFAKKHPASLPKKLVKEAADELIATKRAKRASPRYLSDLEYRLGKFSEHFPVHIGAVTGNEIQRFLDGLELSPQSYINFQRVIGTLCRFAVRRGYLPKDYDELDRIEKVRARNGDAITIYSPEDMARLLRAASPRFLSCLAIAGFAGLRSAEVERLDWSEVHLADRFIEIKVGKSKTASRRLAPISDGLCAWLTPCAKAAGKVWKGTHDEYYDAQQETAAATKTADCPALKWKQNALRHSFISYRLAETQNANQVALECGNTFEMIHQHYKALVRPEAAKRWFDIRPETPANVIPATSARQTVAVAVG